MDSHENFIVIEQIDITISETWLNPSVCDSDINILGYMVILVRQDREAHKQEVIGEDTSYCLHKKHV